MDLRSSITQKEIQSADTGDVDAIISILSRVDKNEREALQPKIPKWIACLVHAEQNPRAWICAGNEYVSQSFNDREKLIIGKALFRRAASYSQDGFAALGLLYYEGKYVIRDYKKAARYFDKCIDLFLPAAMLAKADMYARGLGYEKDAWVSCGILYLLAFEEDNDRFINTNEFSIAQYRLAKACHHCSECEWQISRYVFYEPIHGRAVQNHRGYAVNTETIKHSAKKSE